MGGRGYNNVPDHTKYFKYMAYNLVAFLFVYFFSRAFLQRHRENFISGSR